MNTPSLRTHRVLLACTSLTSIISLTLLFGWGPLTPPAGVVTGTAKPLSEVEPRIAINAANTPGDADSLFRIAQPGSYYLTGNITGVAGKHGIEIAASNVTLDLNGFHLAGVPAMGAFDGVTVTVSSVVNVAVLNGTVRGWGDEGIDLTTFPVVNARIADVICDGNTGRGISVGSSSTVSGCVCSGSQYGIVAGAGCTITACTARTNTVDGIATANGCTVIGCSAMSNAVNGFGVVNGCTVTGCAAFDNTGNGISAASGCTINDCTAYSNNATGILVISGSTVSGCTARGNTLDGIACNAQCQVRGNNCSNNGSGGSGAGIRANTNDCLIEGNNCTGADQGIVAEGAGNIIVRNICAGNTTDWVFVANNYYGPIIDRSGVVTAAVNGPVAAGTMASTDPNANFTH